MLTLELQLLKCWLLTRLVYFLDPEHNFNHYIDSCILFLAVLLVHALSFFFLILQNLFYAPV